MSRPKNWKAMRAAKKLRRKREAEARWEIEQRPLRELRQMAQRAGTERAVAEARTLFSERAEGLPWVSGSAFDVAVAVRWCLRGGKKMPLGCRQPQRLRREAGKAFAAGAAVGRQRFAEAMDGRLDASARRALERLASGGGAYQERVPRDSIERWAVCFYELFDLVALVLAGAVKAWAEPDYMAPLEEVVVNLRLTTRGAVLMRPVVDGRFAVPAKMRSGVVETRFLSHGETDCLTRQRGELSVHRWPMRSVLSSSMPRDPIVAEHFRMEAVSTGDGRYEWMLVER